MKMHMTIIVVFLFCSLLGPGWVMSEEGTPPGKSTTPAPTNTTTTPAPTNTTTTPAPTPTTTEAPPPEHPHNKLNFSKDGKTVCILQNLDATFKVTDNKTVTYYDMVDATVLPAGSSCGDFAKNKTANLTVQWGDKKSLNIFTQWFGIEKNYYYLKHVELSLEGGKYEFNSTLPYGKLLKTNLKSSYKCDTNQSIDVSSNLTMSFSEVRFQAYDIEKDTFSAGSSCPGDLPTPVPEPNWSNNLTVLYENKTACTREIMNVTITLKKEGQKEPVYFNMTAAQVVANESQCGVKGKKPAIVAARWGNNSIRQTFAEKDGYYYLSIINITLNGTSFNISVDDLSNQPQVFYTPFKQSLTCNTPQVVKSGNLTIAFSDVRFQAYDLTNNTFSKEHECSADNGMNSIVPIAVGVALAVLVIIVLIAYLIGRRNSSRAGYESV